MYSIKYKDFFVGKKEMGISDAILIDKDLFRKAVFFSKAEVNDYINNYLPKCLMDESGKTHVIDKSLVTISK